MTRASRYSATEHLRYLQNPGSSSRIPRQAPWTGAATARVRVTSRSSTDNEWNESSRLCCGRQATESDMLSTTIAHQSCLFNNVFVPASNEKKEDFESVLPDALPLVPMRLGKSCVDQSKNVFDFFSSIFQSPVYATNFLTMNSGCSLQMPAQLFVSQLSDFQVFFHSATSPFDRSACSSTDKRSKAKRDFKLYG